MVKLPEQNYKILKELFEFLGFSEEEQKKEIEEFEEDLAFEFAEAAVKKLPEQEREGFIKLINLTDNESKKQLSEKLEYWFNEKEYLALLEKTAEKLFSEMVVFLYKKATEQQKKKLEEMFEPDTLKGIL